MQGPWDHTFEQLTPAHEIQTAASPGDVDKGGYYGLPILKRPFWEWPIALYFFSEGISAGAYVLSTIAELVDKEKFRELIRAGRFLSFTFLLPCPPLLIADLGRPERFHHMLRTFKRTSPMNHGAWALTGYGMFSALVAGLERWTSRGRLSGLVGMPFAWTMVSYPGVLLATTSNPVWSHSNYLGPLFAASSMSTAASALMLCIYRTQNRTIHNTLQKLEDVASIAEAAAIGAYVRTAGKAAKPLIRGKQSKLFLWGAVAFGLIAPALLRRSSSKVLRSGIAPVLALLGGLSLKWSIVHAGQESAMDVDLAVQNAPSKTGEPFWGPRKRTA